MLNNPKIQSKALKTFDLDRFLRILFRIPELNDVRLLGLASIFIGILGFLNPSTILSPLSYVNNELSIPISLFIDLLVILGFLLILSKETGVLAFMLYTLPLQFYIVATWNFAVNDKISYDGVAASLILGIMIYRHIILAVIKDILRGLKPTEKTDYGGDLSTHHWDTGDLGSDTQTIVTHDHQVDQSQGEQAATQAEQKSKLTETRTDNEIKRDSMTVESQQFLNSVGQTYLSDLQDKSKVYETRNNELNDKLQKAVIEKEELRIKIQADESDIEDLKQMVSAQNLQISEQKNTITNLDMSLKNANMNVSVLQSQLTQSQKEIENERELRRKGEEQLRESTRRLDETFARFDDERARATRLQKQLETFMQRMEKVDTDKIARLNLDAAGNILQQPSSSSQSSQSTTTPLPLVDITQESKKLSPVLPTITMPIENSTPKAEPGTEQGKDIP